MRFRMDFLFRTERVKPWGTGHAVLSCRGVVDGPFAVINADDYYGSHAFSMAYQYLTSEDEQTEDGKYHYMMVGYQIENTLTENGYVFRGICETDTDDYLPGISMSGRTSKSVERRQPTQRMMGRHG